jgi:hypothetical protein
MRFWDGAPLMRYGRYGIRRSCRLLLPLFTLTAAILLPTNLHAQNAQTCTLSPPLPPRPTDAAPGTRFLASGREGQIALRAKPSASAVVRVFETDGAEPKPEPKPGNVEMNRATWKVLSEPTVLSVRDAPDKGYEGFLPSDSSVVRFIVPHGENNYWRTRTFVVRFCEPSASGGGWAIVEAIVSSPIHAKLISVAALVLVYLALAWAAANTRAKKHPLAAKYPSFETQRVYGWLEHLDPVILTKIAFNKGSIQKLQVLLFSFLVSGMVLSLVLTLGVLTDLSSTVAVLLGISAVGAAVAQKTTTTRDRLAFENWAWLVRKQVLPINQEDQTGPRWSDLVMTNREFDIYKLQTLIFSAAVAVALLVSGAEHLASFTVPDTLLGILGLSQVVYVAGTLARPPSIGDLDDAITKLREMETKLQTVVARNTDTDGDGKLPAPLPVPPEPLPDPDTRKKRRETR